MSADIGHGAAGFTNVVTKSGNDFVHGSAFEFVRNAAFDARNFFDHSGADRSAPHSAFRAQRIRRHQRRTDRAAENLRRPREDFLFRASIKDSARCWARRRSFAVPTAAERQGIDTTTFPGDTLFVPVSSKIAPILARYPLPNEPSGPFGDRTYAASSKVVTDTDQFSIRVDHQISDKANLFTRFSLNQVNGPTDQSRSDGDRSRLRHQIFRSPAQCSGALYATSFLRA